MKLKQVWISGPVCCDGTVGWVAPVGFFAEVRGGSQCVSGLTSASVVKVLDLTR